MLTVRVIALIMFINIILTSVCGLLFFIVPFSLAVGSLIVGIYKNIMEIFMSVFIQQRFDISQAQPSLANTDGTTLFILFV